MQKLIEKLMTEGGAIVSSNECSEIEMADARVTGRWHANEDGFGFVWRTPEWLALQKRREAETAWQPMETAPKDRTILAVWCNRIIVCKWDDDRHSRKPRPFWNRGDGWITQMRNTLPVLWREMPQMPSAKRSEPA